MKKCSFSISILDDEIKLADYLVKKSIKEHTVSDIFPLEEQYKNRIVGTLGEIVFSRVYGFDAPAKSFGASDGQDNGCDFKFPRGDGNFYCIDLKSMLRKPVKLRSSYSLNISERQLIKKESLTDFYYLINLNIGFEDNNSVSFVKNDNAATFVGLIKKEDILSGKCGTFFPNNSSRENDGGHKFVFRENTYEIYFNELRLPKINKTIEKLKGFKLVKIWK